MNIECYNVHRLSNIDFSFISKGKKGEFYMRINFTMIQFEPPYYNLGFGVVTDNGKEIDDKVEIRNGDTDVILATIGNVALQFLKENPRATILATGSVPEGEMRLRTRKYQMGIGANLQYLLKDHHVLGLVADRIDDEIPAEWPRWPGRWYKFERGTNYDAFLLKLK